MHRILVPIDFSEASANTLRYVAALAERHDFNLTLIHCYPKHDFNREYSFEGTDYAEGIRNKMKEFYQKESTIQKPTTRFEAEEGSIVDQVIARSGSFQCIAISTNAYSNAFTRWLGSRSTTIVAKAKCPVLLVPTNHLPAPWNTVWHIKRQESETELMQSKPFFQRIGFKNIAVKSLDQTHFTSVIWESVISYIKEPKEKLRQEIVDQHPEESIDLFLMIYHSRDSWNNLAENKIKQILFQFDIPILIFHALMIED